MPNLKKQSLLSKTIHSLEESSNFALVKFEKTKQVTFEKLRRELKANSASLTVVKNTLFQKAVNKLVAKNKQLQTFQKQAFPLQENTALLILKNDWSRGLKTFYNFIKTEGTIVFKIGHLDQIVYPQADLKKIAELPSKGELIAKIIGSMKSPLTRTTRAFQFNTQKLVYVLSQKAQKAS